jgi:hypothetical protein
VSLQDEFVHEPWRSITDPGERQALVRELHALKTELFMDIVETGAMPLRPGVRRLVTEALDAGQGPGGGRVGVAGGGGGGRLRRV